MEILIYIFATNGVYVSPAWGAFVALQIMPFASAPAVNLLQSTHSPHPSHSMGVGGGGDRLTCIIIFGKCQLHFIDWAIYVIYFHLHASDHQLNREDIFSQGARATVRGREHELNHIKHLLTTRHQQQQQKLKQSRPPIGIIIVKLLTNPLMFNSPSNCQSASAASHQPVQFAFVDDY